MFKLFHIIMACGSYIRSCTRYLQVALAVFFISSFISNNTTAQKKSYDNKKSKRNYYINYEKGFSSKSSASNVDYRNNKSDNKYSDEYKRNTSKETDSYKIKGKHFRNYESELSENYFRIDKSKNSLWDGKHWQESKFPLNIYVKESSSRYYKSVYKAYVKYAMDVWRKADDRIQYKFTKSIDDADIALIFMENLGDEYEEDYLGLTDYDTNINKQIEFSKIQISLIKNGNEKISAGELKATIVHEFGHALGLGHSDNKKDLLYPYISPEHTAEMTYDELSRGDKLAIKDVINLSFVNNYVWK